MIRPVEEIQVHLCRDVVDSRQQMRGLSVLVEEELELDVFSSHLFSFCNRRGDHVKLLLWERNGFVIWQKNLEKDRFPWPRNVDTEVVELSGQELNWLLGGRDVFSALRSHGAL